jgi:hypothetical protein
VVVVQLDRALRSHERGNAEGTGPQREAFTLFSLLIDPDRLTGGVVWV